jgi:hypothetical protein
MTGYPGMPYEFIAHGADQVAVPFELSVLVMTPNRLAVRLESQDATLSVVTWLLQE